MAAKNAERGLVEQWREILSLHARTQCELDRVLHGHGLCASDFEVLDVLAEGVASGGNCAYRVQEIADRVHLSQSALSRLIARLEKDGLVERGMCAEDRRAVRVSSPRRVPRCTVRYSPCSARCCPGCWPEPTDRPRIPDRSRHSAASAGSPVTRGMAVRFHSAGHNWSAGPDSSASAVLSAARTARAGPP